MSSSVSSCSATAVVTEPITLSPLAGSTYSAPVARATCDAASHSAAAIAGRSRRIAWIMQPFLGLTRLIVTRPPCDCPCISCDLDRLTGSEDAISLAGAREAYALQTDDRAVRPRPDPFPP